MDKPDNPFVWVRITRICPNGAALTRCAGAGRQRSVSGATALQSMYAWPSAELMSRLSAIDPAQARAARGEPFPFASKKNTGESDSELMLTRWCPAARSIDIAGHGGR